MPTVFVLVDLFFGEASSVLGVFTHRRYAEDHLEILRKEAETARINVEYEIEEHEINKLHARVD